MRFTEEIDDFEELYIEDKYGVESSSWHNEKSEFRTQCLVFDGG